MGVICRPVGRGDFLLHRGATERKGVRWEQDRLDGRGFVPVDLTGWVARYEMSLSDGRVVYARDASTNRYGLAWVEIPADAFTGPEWDGRGMGSWRIRASEPVAGRVEILGWGYWTLI